MRDDKMEHPSARRARTLVTHLAPQTADENTRALMSPVARGNDTRFH